MAERLAGALLADRLPTLATKHVFENVYLGNPRKTRLQDVLWTLKVGKVI